MKKTTYPEEFSYLETIQGKIRAFSDDELAFELARRGIRPDEYETVFRIQYAREQISTAIDEALQVQHEIV